MTPHPDRRRLHAFVDGRLDEGEAARVSDHLGSCWACAGRLREIDAVRAAAHDLRGPVEPGRDLWPEIEARVRAVEEGAGPVAGAGLVPPRGAGPGLRSSAVARWMGVAALLTLATLASLRFGEGDRPVDGADRVAATTEPSVGATDVSSAALEARYGPELRRLASLVESRSAERGLDVASASEPDLSAFRSARSELVDAVASAPDPAPLLVELEAAYERERRYLVRLVELVGP